MDIRNIKAPEYKNGMDVLGRMFSLQKELLDDYVKIENLSPYPFSMNKKSDQLQIKDFISRVVEELAEAHESYRVMFDLMDNNKEEEVRPFYENFLEELADAWHFLLETFIYCNIDEHSIHDYAMTIIKNMGYNNIALENPALLRTPLGSFFLLARKYNEDEGHIQSKNLTIHYRLGNNVADYIAGRDISRNLVDWHSQMLWEITYHLNIARNFLKNKPWKQSEMVTDVKKFQECLMKAFLAFIAYMDFIDLREKEIYTLYYKKNQVNRFRIKSKY